MLQRLRLKLTLINTSIILLLFLILIVGSYWFTERDMARHREFISQKIVEDIQAGIITDQPRRPGFPPGPAAPLAGPPPDSSREPPPGPNFFFVKTSPAGVITFQSANQPLYADSPAALAENALGADGTHGIIAVGENKYSYRKAPLADQAGMLILFSDLEQETKMLRTLLTALSMVGIICALLSFGISFFMAHHAMLPIRRAWQQQKDFLADASHELRTPLAVIQTNLDIVKGNSNESVSSQNKWLDNIQEESCCMAKLVDSLLFLARSDAQQQLLDQQPFSLSTALRQAVSPFKATAKIKNLDLEVVADGQIDMCGDEARMKQVIGILVDNAIRHTPANGKVSVSLSRRKSEVLLAVTDTGEGIHPEHLNKIFDRFYQIDQARAKGNAGLGLAIAKCIVEGHGGAISVASTPGAGTAFTVQLPQKII